MPFKLAMRMHAMPVPAAMAFNPGGHSLLLFGVNPKLEVIRCIIYNGIECSPYCSYWRYPPQNDPLVQMVGLLRYSRSSTLVLIQLTLVLTGAYTYSTRSWCHKQTMPFDQALNQIMF